MQHSQNFLPMGNKSHSAPISIFMAKIDECKYKEILHHDEFLTGKVQNISSYIEYRYHKQVQFIKSRKYLASVLYNKCLPFQHLTMCLACTPYLIHTDDALHLYQKSSLVLNILVLHLYCICLLILHILHRGCT